MTIPKEIQRYLARDETVEKEFHCRDLLGSSGCRVYASNKRLFIIRGDSIKDVDYRHIASVELKQEASVPLVVIGVVCLVAGVVVLSLRFNESLAVALIVLGLVVSILGAVIRRQSIKLVIAGVADAETLSGYRSELDALLRIVREKRSIEE